MKKTVLAFWIIATLFITLSYAAVQGDFIINVVDATTSTKFYRVVGSIANGMRVDVTRLSAGTKTPSDAFANPTDAITTWSLVGTYNGTTWDMLRSQGNNADAVATSTTGVLKTASFNSLWNGTTWDRLLGQGNNADNVSVVSLGTARTSSYNYVYDGTQWDRLPGNSTDGAQTYLGRVTTSTVSSSVATTLVSVLTATSTTRRMVTIFNEGSVSCYVKLGNAATLNSYTVKLQPESYWEMPLVTYTGSISSLCTGTTGTLLITTY